MLRTKVRAGRRLKSRRANAGKRKLALKRGRRLHGTGHRKNRSKRRGRFQRRRYLNHRRKRNLASDPIDVAVPEEVANDSESYQNSYNDAYQEGFDSGFSQGFEDGHKIGYKERI